MKRRCPVCDHKLSRRQVFGTGIGRPATACGECRSRLEVDAKRWRLFAITYW